MFDLSDIGRDQRIVDRSDGHGVFAAVGIAELILPDVSVVGFIRERTNLVVDDLIRFIIAHLDTIRTICIVFVDDELFVSTTVYTVNEDSERIADFERARCLVHTFH